MGNCLSSTSAAATDDPAANPAASTATKGGEETAPATTTTTTKNNGNNTRTRSGMDTTENTTGIESVSASVASAGTPMHDASVKGSTPMRDASGNETLGAEYDRNTLEDMDYEGEYPSTLQEELNEMLEAVYALISEEDIRSYQQYLEGIQKQQIAEQAVKALSKAPGFELIDQDNERVSLEGLCEKGPVILQFYRGKWCPHCNAGLMAYNKYLQDIQKAGAQFVAISPMLPDGSQFLASKRDLNFAVLSDCGNTVAREYKVTFVVPEDIRPTFEAWGHDVAKANGDDLWEVPLAATYIINQNQEVVWTFVDNDHGCWAEPSDVLKALDEFCGNNNAATTAKGPNNTNAKTRGKGSVGAQKPKRSIFGPKKQSAAEYVSAYPS